MALFWRNATVWFVLWYFCETPRVLLGNRKSARKQHMINVFDWKHWSRYGDSMLRSIWYESFCYQKQKWSGYYGHAVRGPILFKRTYYSTVTLPERPQKDNVWTVSQQIFLYYVSEVKSRDEIQDFYLPHHRHRERLHDCVCDGAASSVQSVRA